MLSVAMVKRGLSRSDLTRPVEGRMVAGVAAGLADALAIDRNVVRCGFVVLSIASGLGVVCYLVAWALMPERTEDRRSPAPDLIATLAFGAVVLGGLLLMRAIGVWPGDVVVWPLAAAIAGLALLAMRSSPNGDAVALPEWPILRRLPPDAADAITVLVGTRRGAIARIAVGAACVLIGVVAFIVTVDSWRALRGAVVAAIAVLAGIALVIGPGVMRLVHAFVAERRERIRSDERAEVAAHLHDSVLQTLALVQRRADDPREVVRLARMQERELRDWLLRGDAATPAAASIGIALEEVAADVERERSVQIDVVRVRDCELDGLEPLLLAAREAMVNAAQHSGVTTVSVYLEVEPERVTVFVRDRGKGFDPAAVPSDRGGITNSIVGRLARAGGRASVRSTQQEGTEIELELPRARA
jgi:signal transduction histidine kinase/phage shock protein PspC (stress-responsive transcriptional regulator)